LQAVRLSRELCWDWLITNNNLAKGTKNNRHYVSEIFLLVS